MITFKTFEDLEAYLKDHTDLCMVRKYLQDKLKQEIAFLAKDYKRKHSTIDWKSSDVKQAKKIASDTAKEDYLEDINYFLLNNVTLSHMSVIGYRRKPHTWAIAEAIKEFIRFQEEA